MDDQLKLKIAASLDLPSDAAADPDVVNAVDVDPAAREFARGMHTLEAALRAWPSRARSDAQWERFANNTLAKLDEVAKVKSARTVSRDEADPAAAPVFEDETPSRMESKQAMSELQDNDNDLEALAALTRPSSVVPSIPPKPTAPSITDAIDDTSSGVVDIKQLAETAKKSAPPAEAPEAEAKGEENGKSDAKPANGAKKSDVMSGVVDAVRTESVRAKSAHKDDVMVTPKRATTPAAEVAPPPKAGRGGAAWGLVGGVAISALAFALYTNSQRNSPAAFQGTAPVSEGAPVASAPPPPPSPTTPEATNTATATPAAMPAPTPPSPVAAPPAVPTESAADRGALAQNTVAADPAAGPPAPTTRADEEQAEARAHTGSVGGLAAERESAPRVEAPVAANTHADSARRAVVARAPAPTTTAPATPPPAAAQVAPARTTTTATAAAPANAPAGGATATTARGSSAPAARPGGSGTGAPSGASIDDLLTRAGGGDAPAMRTQAPAPAPAADLPERPTRSQVTAVLTPLNGAVRQCAGSQTGTAPVSITINSDGSVRTATVGGPFAGSSVGECIAGVVRRAHFQPFRAQQAQITWPFVILPQR